MRSVQKLANDEWQPIQFYNLQYGDYFRMFDNITPVSDNGKHIFIATSSPYYNDEGHYKIDCETY
ncbi:hypothetical protein [Paenibacillus odorifer]|uniref:hypothetical protein n=1 Tax=Paenibacillus odorifer TaxID=189426 RepID=UPI00096DA876|nr:hypothetical protein [Paenibacillus odorifer]OMD76873.1 hypothetical protein BSK50_14065 [Paenibacillus odorifer]